MIVDFKTLHVRTVTRFGRKDFYPANELARMFVDKGSECIRPSKIAELQRQGWEVVESAE
jgi:hypothetical protein